MKRAAVSAEDYQSRKRINLRELSVELEAIADQIPSMGGKKIAPLLRQATRNAPADTSVVEVGCWLGAGTAQLALGIRERQCAEDVSLHCFDQWKATPGEVEKAARWGVGLSVWEDTLPRVRRALEPFNVPIRFHKGDIRRSRWDGGPISVYVDDLSKSPSKFIRALLTFGPWWVPGETVIVLMDYDMWKKTGAAAHKCQKHFVEANSNCFEPIEHEAHAIKSSVAVFLYRQPIDSIKNGRWRDLWHIWLQLRQETGVLSMLKAGYWRDFFHLFLLPWPLLAFIVSQLNAALRRRWPGARVA